MKRFTSVGRRVATIGMGGLAAWSVLAVPALATVEPSIYETSLASGESVTVNKRVTTPEAGPSRVDVMLDVDLSGSYWDDLPNLVAQLPGVFDEVSAASDARFGLATFVDHPYEPWGWWDGDYAHRLDLDLTSDRGAFVDAVESMVSLSGSDWAESQYESLYQIATGAGRDTPGDRDVAPGQDASFRADAMKVVVITTDAGFHVAGDSTCEYDAGCPFAYPGPTAAETIDALTDAGIRVIALKAPGADFEMDELAAATGGSVQETTGTSSDVAQAILAGLDEISAIVQPSVSAGCPLDVSFSPSSYAEVAPGQTVEFQESIGVPADTAVTGTITCTVDFGAAGTQTIVVRPDCLETGLGALSLGGLASGAVHDLEPRLGALAPGAEALAHALNCEVVVPVERLIDRLLGF